MTAIWPAGASTGVGSLPGSDPDDSIRLVLGEVEGLPYLPELPARGAGADMIGRGAALLVELPVEIQPSGWRLTGRPGRELQRARDLLERDLDALEKQASDRDGALKVQVPGPWTLAASIELPNGHRVVSDPGAVRDLGESLAAGLRAHLDDLARRLPGVHLVVQVDEPSLPAVLAGRVRTPSGFGTVRAVDEPVARAVLAGVLDAAPAGGRIVHCCASDVPFEVLRSAGATALGVDLDVLPATAAVLDQLGSAVDAGVALFLGIVPSTDAAITLETARDRVLRLWDTVGFARDRLATAVVPTPACGLAGASPAYVRRAMAVLRDVGRALAELES